jgi:hypothetical protein
MEEKFNKTVCLEFEALLEDHITGELSGADARKLADHLEVCATCSMALAEAAPSVRLLQVGEGMRDPGPGFSHLVMARIREMNRQTEDKSIWHPFVAFAWRFSATAALALAALFTLDVVHHNQIGQQTNAALTSTTEARDLFPDPTTPPTNSDDALMMVVESNHGKH